MLGGLASFQLHNLLARPYLRDSDDCHGDLLRLNVQRALGSSSDWGSDGEADQCYDFQAEGKTRVSLIICRPNHYSSYLEQ